MAIVAGHSFKAKPAEPEMVSRNVRSETIKMVKRSQDLRDLKFLGWWDVVGLFHVF